MREPTQKLSYCWLAPTRWANGSATGSGDLTPTPPAYEMQATLLAPPGTDFMTLRTTGSANSLSELDGRALARARSMRNALPHGGASGVMHSSQAPINTVITGDTPPPAFSSIIRQQHSGSSTSPPPAFSSLAPNQPSGSSPPPAFSSLAPTTSKGPKSPLTSSATAVTTSAAVNNASSLSQHHHHLQHHSHLHHHHPLASPNTTTTTQASSLITPATSPLSSSIITSPNLTFAPGSPPTAPPLKPSSPTTTYSLIPTSSSSTTTVTSPSTTAGIASPPRKFASPTPLPPPLVTDAQRGLAPRMPSGVRGVERGNNGLVGILVQKDVDVISRMREKPPGFM